MGCHEREAFALCKLVLLKLEIKKAARSGCKSEAKCES